jgi:hypothetical protein
VKSVYELALFASNGRALGKEKIKEENAKLPCHREHAEKKETIAAIAPILPSIPFPSFFLIFHVVGFRSKNVYVMCFNSYSTGIGKQNHARFKALSRELD